MGTPVIPYQRPRIKFEHRPMLRTDGTIQIGGDVYGIATLIEDPERWIWPALQLLDGTRTVAAILADADAAPSDVADLLRTVYAWGFLEDAATADATTLTVEEQDRYSRVHGYYRWIDLTPRRTAWTPQERIKAATVVVVGLGGSGSTAALALAASGVGHLQVVDFDRVELSNLTRQFLYAESDVGRPKVDAAVDRLRAVNSAITVSGADRRIEGPDDLVELAGGADVLVLAADRPRDINHWAARACATVGRPWVTGGYVGPSVNAQTYLPGTGPCFECLHLRRNELSSGAPPAGPAPWTNDEVGASSAPAAAVTGALYAHAALAHITGAPDHGANFGFGINLAAPQQHVYLAPDPHPDCPLCAEEVIT